MGGCSAVLGSCGAALSRLVDGKTGAVSASTIEQGAMDKIAMNMMWRESFVFMMLEIEIINKWELPTMQPRIIH